MPSAVIRIGFFITKKKLQASKALDFCLNLIFKTRPLHSGYFTCFRGRDQGKSGCVGKKVKVRVDSLGSLL